MTGLLPAPRPALENATGSAAGGLDFVAIDVETANARRGSIFAIGAAVVRDGVVVSTHSWLTRPPAGLDHFDGINISLHGITPDMVADQPTFAERLDQLLQLTGGLPLLAHNAAFDIGALREACIAVDREWPTTDYACSLIMARRALDLISYRLPMVAAECGWISPRTTRRARTRSPARTSSWRSPAVGTRTPSATCSPACRCSPADWRPRLGPGAAVRPPARDPSCPTSRPTPTPSTRCSGRSWSSPAR